MPTLGHATGKIILLVCLGGKTMTNVLVDFGESIGDDCQICQCFAPLHHFVLCDITAHVMLLLLM